MGLAPASTPLAKCRPNARRRASSAPEDTGREPAEAAEDAGRERRALLAKALPHWEEAQAKTRKLLGGDTALAGATTIANLVNCFVMTAKKV